MSYEIKNQVIEAQHGQGTGQNGPIMPAALDLDIERSIRLYPKLAIGVAAVALVVIVGYAMRLKPMYSAETSVYIQPVATKVLSDGTPGYYDANKYDSYIQQQILTATRPDILKAALDKMPAGSWQQPGESQEQALNRLQSALKVQRVQTTYQLTFGVSAPDQAAVAPAANAVTEAFLKLGRKDELSQTDERMQLLAEERDRITKELESEREEQRQLSTSIGVANPAGEAGNPYDTQLMELRSQLSTARKDRDVAASQLESVSGPSPAALDAAAEELIANDTALTSMRSSTSQRKGQLAGQMAGLTPNNPLYRQDQLEMQQLDKQLDTMTAQMREKAARRLQDKLRLDLARTADVESRLNSQLAKQTGTATSAAPKLQRATELVADITRMQQRYAAIDDTMRSLALESSSPGLAHLVGAATPPDGPDPSRRKILLLLAIPLALFLGAGAAVIATKRDRHIYIGKDLDKLLGFQPIAVLPARADVSQSVMDEYVLRLAGGIDQALRRGRARSYLLTGASSTVETTDLVRDLADKMEQLGFRTILVSAAAVLQPLPDGVAQSDSVSISRGMASALSGVHQSLLVANLEKLKRGNDLLLIESDPLLVSAETEYVARLADVTIVIAESGVTLRSDLTRSAALLKRLSASGVGAVLTEVHLNAADQAFRSSIKALESRQHIGTRVAHERPERPVLHESEPETHAPVVETPEEFVAAHEYYDPTPAETAAVVEHVEPVAELEPLHEEAIAGPAYEAFEAEPSVVAEPVVEHFVPEPVMEAAALEYVEPEQFEPVHHEPTIFAQYAASAAHFDPIHVETPAVQTPSTEIVEEPARPYMEHVAPVEPIAAVEPERDVADVHFDPNISRQRVAFRGALGRVRSDEEEQPKSSWVHRLFRREPEHMSYSIIPTDDDDDIEEMDVASAPIAPFVAEPPVEPIQEMEAPPVIEAEPILHEAVAEPEEILSEQPVTVDAVHEPEPVFELPVSAEMEPVPEIHWQPLAHHAAPIVEEIAESASEHVEPVAEAEVFVAVEAAKGPKHWASVDAEPEAATYAPEENIAFAEEPQVAPVAETHEPLHVEAQYEPSAESVNSVVEPLVADLEPKPEFEVSMPLVPMSSDFHEEPFEQQPSPSAWPSFAAMDPEPTPVAQESRFNDYESYRSAAAVAEPEQTAIAAEPVHTPEPVAVEPEPVFAAAEPVAPKHTQRETERPAHAPGRRFHLLSQFDRPLASRNDARESNGGSR